MPRVPPSAWLQWLLLAALLLAPLSSAAAGPATVRIGGVDYADVRTFAATAGLALRWSNGQQNLLLSNRDLRIELEADSRETRINGRRVFLGEATVRRGRTLLVSVIDRDRLLLPLAAPRRIPGPVPGLRTIVLDAGHGGRDDGTRNPKLGYLEKNQTLAVARRVEALLTAAGFQVVMTRRTDVFIPLPDRPAIANRIKADLFISVHFNAIDNRSISGVETYILTPQHQRSTGSDRPQAADAERLPGNARDPWNAQLGFRMHASLLRELGSPDRGLKRARFAVLRDLDCPGVLVEGGYLSNDAEARRIVSAAWQERLARAIVAGVVDYRAALEAARKR